MVVPDSRVSLADDLWRLTMEHSPVGMAIVSLAGGVVTANGALCDMLGYEPDELVTLTLSDITHPDDLADDLRLVDRTLAGEIGSYRITKRYVRSDGRIVVGDLSVALLRDAGGAPVHFVSQVADLTERQAFVERLDAAESAVETERRKAHAIFEGVSVGLLQVDTRGRYLACNDRLRDFLALAFPSGHRGLAGQAGFTYSADQQHVLAPRDMPSARAARGEEFDDLRVWVGKDPAARRALSVSSRAVVDRAGTASGAVLAYHDVTDLVRALNVKDEFVATVSHELRTPLTSALAYLELLDESSDVSREDQQQVNAVRRNVLRLSHLVADLLYSTRASAGSALVDRYPVDLASVLDQAVDAAQLDAAHRGVRITCRRPASLALVADGMRLRQVLDNLLANAIAYSPPGGTVAVDLVRDGAHAVVTVADHGPGMDDDEVGEVFERFFRGRNARRLRVPGAGLGLHNVRTIIEAHGGEVRFESAPGAGTCVRVLLPGGHD